MNFSAILASIALFLGLAKPPAPPAEDAQPQTHQQQIDQREAQRRTAVAEQQKRSTEFARACKKPELTASELAACREAYRRMSVN